MRITRGYVKQAAAGVLGLLMAPSAALAKSKFLSLSLPRYHHQYLPDEVQYEQGALSVTEIRQLRAMGHRLKSLRRPYGNMQAVYWDRREGEVLAASDPRGIGSVELR